MNNRVLVIDALAYAPQKAYGFQEYMFNLLDAMHNNQEKINFSKIVIVSDQRFIKDFKPFEPKFKVFGLSGSSYLMRFLSQTTFPIKLGLKRNDVILSLYNYSSPFKKCKNVLVVHDLLYLRKDLVNNFFFRFHRYLFIPTSIKNADTIIAISNFTKLDITENFPRAKNKIVTAYNWINFSKFLNNSDDPTSRELSESFFLTVSSSSKHKNTITILKAFASFCKIEDKTLLYFVGGGFNETCLEFYNSLDSNIKSRIKIFSNISNAFLGDLYRNCKSFISASYFEGLGMPVVEAMYFGTPLILSDLPVHREIAPINSHFFSPSSAFELSEILKSNNFKRNDNSNFFNEKFSLKKTFNIYIDVLNQIN